MLPFCDPFHCAGSVGQRFWRSSRALPAVPVISFRPLPALYQVPPPWDPDSIADLLTPYLFLLGGVLSSLVAVDPHDPLVVAVPSDVEKMRVQVRVVETTGTEANSLG